ncbi:hypothetical protein NQZ68_024823 [Dissostichus eleginoides]|nr:hypothetical protein NQZ68_024823 [Dissostichus eleginoides]
MADIAAEYPYKKEDHHSMKEKEVPPTSSIGGVSPIHSTIKHNMEVTPAGDANKQVITGGSVRTDPWIGPAADWQKGGPEEPKGK